MNNHLTPDQTDDLPTDQGWDNRRLILAALAPRSTTRPARHTPPTTASDTDPHTDPHTDHPTPGPLSRARAAATAAATRINKRIPPHRRVKTLVATAGAGLLLMGALTAVKSLTNDVSAPPATAAVAPQPPPPPSTPPLVRDTILTGIRAIDKCPRDPRYTDINRAFDTDLNTAWVCTRVNNQDGQLIQVDFGRQVTITQIRCDCGFDAIAPDGTDQWSQHRIVTQLEVWFPKDLNRKPATIDTEGERNWRGIPGGLQPPATVSKLILRVAATSDPPQSTAPTRQTTTAPPAGADDATTVAISSIQFIGHDATAQPG